MFKYTVILLAIRAMSKFQTIEGYFHVGDCSIPDRSNCTWPELVRFEYYIAAEQFAPKIDDPDHLFNLIHSPEKNCIDVVISKSTTPFGKFELILELMCASSPYNSYQLNFDLSFRYTNNRLTVSCFTRNTRTTLHGSNCGHFVHEQLRLTFLENGNQLLIEDLSDKVPVGTWIMLQKRIGYRFSKKCICSNLGSYWDEKMFCFVGVKSNHQWDTFEKYFFCIYFLIKCSKVDQNMRSTRRLQPAYEMQYITCKSSRFRSVLLKLDFKLNLKTMHLLKVFKFL